MIFFGGAYRRLPPLQKEVLMVILISGASHTGKTALAHRLMREYGYPYLSIDHLKMGLIRANYTSLTPSDDEQLTPYLWPVLREMVKTAIENDQNLIIEGCYIPHTWRSDFDEEYLPHIRCTWLIMSERYIRTRYADIRQFASVIENRGDDPDLSLDALLRDNARNLAQCQQHGCPYIFIDDEYSVPFTL